MHRLQRLTLFFCIAACTPAETPLPSATSSRETLTGRAAYEKACAECHDQGKDGAPAVGDRDAWADRSPLWVAVLAEHAKDGYLNMPARGGDPELSDKEVNAAAEYMLTLTHPEWPSD